MPATRPPASRSPDPALLDAAEEHELLAALAGGDRRAAERLAEATYRQTWAVLVRLCGGDLDLAADLTQETYRKAWESIGRFRGGARLATWLFRIAYTTFVNHKRRPMRLVPLADGFDEVMADGEPSSEELFSGEEQGRRLRRAVLDLDDTLRFAVTARYWAELPVEEIARLEGVTAMGVRKRLARAFQTLAAALKEPKS